MPAKLTDFFFYLIFLPFATSRGRLTERERVEVFHNRNYRWPPPHEQYIPATDGWVKLQQKRFDQVFKVEDLGKRYDGWTQSVSSAYVQPNFTETGWGLTRAPQELADKLRNFVRKNYEEENYRLENAIEVIDGERPIFIKGEHLKKEVLGTLHPMHEAWSGVELQPFTAYGFRLYRNNSSLLLHTDKPTTHIISCILHIDSSDDSEPWPIIIEDFLGNTNEVVLAPGDMLFYESSKCFHGRPQNFQGSWYSSIFVHYFPVSEEWRTKDRELEMHYGVPPGWASDTKWPSDYPKLEIKGTSMREPECKPKNWCADTVKWHGPAEEDYVITTGSKYRLYTDEELTEF